MVKKSFATVRRPSSFISVDVDPNDTFSAYLYRINKSSSLPSHLVHPQNPQYFDSQPLATNQEKPLTKFIDLQHKNKQIPPNSGRHFLLDPFWIPSHLVRTTFDEVYLHNQKEQCDVIVRLKTANIDRDRMPIKVVYRPVGAKYL
jgi:hypothetical protein